MASFYPSIDGTSNPLLSPITELINSDSASGSLPPFIGNLIDVFLTATFLPNAEKTSYTHFAVSLAVLFPFFFISYIIIRLFVKKHKFEYGKYLQLNEFSYKYSKCHSFWIFFLQFSCKSLLLAAIAIDNWDILMYSYGKSDYKLSFSWGAQKISLNLLDSNSKSVSNDFFPYSTKYSDGCSLVDSSDTVKYVCTLYRVVGLETLIFMCFSVICIGISFFIKIFRGCRRRTEPLINPTVAFLDASGALCIFYGVLIWILGYHFSRKDQVKAGNIPGDEPTLGISIFCALAAYVAQLIVLYMSRRRLYYSRLSSPLDLMYDQTTLNSFNQPAAMVSSAPVYYVPVTNNNNSLNYSTNQEGYHRM